MSVSTPSAQPQPHHTTSTSGSTSTGISTSGSSSESNSESSSESTSGSSSTASSNATTTQPPATLLYPAWNIVWEQQDASALSPEPPVLSVEKTVPTWEPGTTIDESFKRRLTDGSAFGRSIAKGIIGIVVGTVAGILIVAGISFFFILRNKKRNRRLQEAIELQERYDSSRRDRVPDEPLPIYPSQGTHDNTVHIAGHQPGAQSHLPPYKERASEDSGDHNRYRDDCPGGEDTSRGHERQSSGNSSATLDGNERSQRGNGERDAGDTTRPSQTTDDITTVRQS